jgi:hypothetical protein
MHPIWARRFEPPAITTSESFGVIGTLLQVYRRTADRKYLEPIPKALEYLASCELPDGQVARFYELETDRPLYFDRDYHLTYDDGELPTHYGFKLDSQVDALREQYRRHSRTAPEDLRRSAARQSRPSDRYIAELIESTDRRGIWVSDGGMKYHQWSGPTIKMRVVVEHLHSLADYLQATSPTTDR